MNGLSPLGGDSHLQQMPTDSRVDVLIAAVDAVMEKANATAAEQRKMAAEMHLLAVSVASLAASVAGHSARVAPLEDAVARQAGEIAALDQSLATSSSALSASITSLNSTAKALNHFLGEARSESSSLAETVATLSSRLARVNQSAIARSAALAEALSAIELTPGPPGQAGLNGSCVKFGNGEPVECPQVGSYAGASDVTALQVTVATLSRMVWMMEQKAEERVRTEGSSGITRVQNTIVGSRAYHDGTDVSFSAITIHDHANHRYTIGVGQLSAAINGFCFTSRHNDYQMSQSTANRTGNMRSLGPIEYPPVPPSVLALPTVAEQAAEMREYFRAWQTSDPSIRDYRPYFKPALCVLEMAWLDGNADLIDPFASERHKLAAKTWDELRGRVAWLLETGHKETYENVGFFPASVRGVNADGTPKISNLDYRIFCHRTERHIPISQLRPVDTLAPRLSTAVSTSRARLHLDRRTRFQLNPRVDDNAFWPDSPTWWQKIDDIMQEIPGRDGYNSYIEDYEYAGGQNSMHRTFSFNDDSKRLNAANYHRFYKTQVGDATGRQYRRRGFSDMNLFAARTTQPEVTGSANPAFGEAMGGGEREHKWTYAIPLELVYLTPLNSWNPFNLDYNSNCAQYTQGSMNERTGDVGDPAKAYNGSCVQHFYRTPEQFFDSTANITSDPADTGAGVVGVLDMQGNLRRTLASGNYIVTPAIEGLGQVRLRYPIYSTHWEGSTSWKEIKALQALTFEAEVSSARSGLSDVLIEVAGLDLTTSGSTSGTAHTHRVYLTPDQVTQLDLGETVTAASTAVEGHAHSFVVRRSSRGSSWAYIVSECDGLISCAHGHATLAVSPRQHQH